MYVTQLLDENDTRYNMLRVMLLLGTPDRDKLDRIFRELIHRHESLRTSFEAVDEEPLQKVHDPGQIPFNLETDDLPPGLSEDRFIRDFIRPFDLSKAPLFRVGLLQTAAQRYLLIIDMHHIITDGISLAILSGEFMALYRGETLTPLRLHYKDFSHWQNRFFQSGEIKKQEEYWLTQLAGELPVLRLPTDFPRTADPPGGGYLVVFAISQALTAALKKLMAETHSTLYMLFLTVCTILLSKYSGQEDIVVGSGVSGRRHPDLENIIGIFVNLLPMRNRPQKDKPFIAFLSEVRENVLEAFSNQDYPFEELVRKLNLQRELSRNPLFDAAVQIRNIEIPELEIPGLTVKPYEDPGSQVRFDLLITGSEKNGVIRVSVTYSSALFKKTFGEKLQKHLLELVEQVVADPGIRLKDLELSTTLASVAPVISKQDNLFRF